MKTKLTLTIEDTVVIFAKKICSKKGKSLSHLVENYLKSIIVKKINHPSVSLKVSKLMGILQLPDDFDYKTGLTNALSKKYKK